MLTKSAVNNTLCSKSKKDFENKCKKVCRKENYPYLCNPISRDTYCGNSSVGRAQPCQGWGREFESRFPLEIGC